MSFWSKFPFFRYLLWLVAGILSAFLTPHLALPLVFSGYGLAAYGILLLVLAFIYTLLSVIASAHKTIFPFWQGFLASAMVFLAGYGSVQANSLKVPEALQVDAPEAEKGYWLVKLRNDAVPTAKSLKMQVSLLAVNMEGSWEQAEGELMLYIRQKGMQALPRHGDRLLVQAQLKPIPEPLNPDAFNYREYMASQGICCQAFVSAEQVELLPSLGRESLAGRALQIRRWASRKVAHYVKGSKEAAIVNALVLGYRETLDEELRQAYATAGAMHILAVSGLHVGFIYLFIKLLLRPWRRYPLLKLAGFAITLLLLWSYAFITGLSPSVLRAVWMFSLLDMALLIKRRTAIYNTLSIAAFFMLLYNPFMLKMLGFQLSFLSLLGIVYLQPRLARWYKGENRVISWAWNLMAVSIAAQLATFPLGLYYFGQFPAYFIISNLLVVPFAAFILGLGLLMLGTSLIWPLLASWIGWVLGWLVTLVNTVVFFTESLPYSRLTAHIDEWQLVLLFLMTIALLVFLRYKKFVFAMMLALIGIGFFGSLIYEEYRQRTQQKLVLFQVPGFTALQLVDGKGDYLLADSSLPATMIKYNVQPSRTSMGFSAYSAGLNEGRKKPPLVEKQAYLLLVWQGLRIVYLKAAPLNPCLSGSPLEVDYVIIADNAVQELDWLLCYFHPKKLLIDGSNKYFLQKKLKQEAEALQIPVHVTAEEGAFERREVRSEKIEMRSEK